MSEDCKKTKRRVKKIEAETRKIEAEIRKLEQRLQRPRVTQGCGLLRSKEKNKNGAEKKLTTMKTCFIDLTQE